MSGGGKGEFWGVRVVKFGVVRRGSSRKGVAVLMNERV